MCSTASRIVSPAAWARTSLAAEIDVDPRHRRQGHGGIRGHRERDPRVQDRLGGLPQQRVHLRDGQLRHPLRNRALGLNLHLHRPRAVHGPPPVWPGGYRRGRPRLPARSSLSRHREPEPRRDPERGVADR